MQTRLSKSSQLWPLFLIFISISFICKCKTSPKLDSTLKAPTPTAVHTQQPLYLIKKASGPIKIDGQLNESAWTKAEVINLEYPWSKNKELREHTNIRLLWDEKNIYFSVKALDENVWALNSQKNAAGEFVRDQDVGKDDCVQFFIAPVETTPKIYTAMEINVLGAVADYVAEAAAHEKVNFNFAFDIKGLIIKTSLISPSSLNNKTDVDSGWIAEALIPFASFKDIDKAPQKGVVWRGNLNRCGAENTYGEHGTWATNNNKVPNFHTPASFGYFKFE